MSPLEYFIQFLKDEGYTDVKILPDGRYAAIAKFIFTHGCIVGKVGDMCGIDDRWCYHDYASAKVALDNWDGVGEPQGWHRHVGSGRRRENGDPNKETINF